MTNSEQPENLTSPRAVRNYLAEWDLTPDEVNEIVAENPPVLSTLSGLVAEYKLKKVWLLRPELSNLIRPRSHDRRSKGDFRFAYRGREFTLEVKSLDVPKVRRKDDHFEGTFQCNASDAREVQLPNGDRLTTNCLVVGGFDVLAVSLFAFERRWVYAFARNADLPRSTWARYSECQRQYLLKSSMRITWPLTPPYLDSLFAVLDLILSESGQ